MVPGVLRGKVGILLGFVPLIVYGILARDTVSSVVIALGAAILATVLVSFPDLRQGILLAWANLALFGAAFVAIGVLGITALIPWMGAIIYAVLSTVAFGSLAAGSPFTLQYARGMVEPTLWENPGFIAVNYRMTGVWGAVFGINLAVSCLSVAFPGTAGSFANQLTVGVLLAGILFTVWYPGYIRRKHAARTKG